MRYEQKQPPHPRKRNVEIITFNFSSASDGDILAKLEKVKNSDESVSAYIKRLIRENIKYGDY